jgi:hypothetical protein
VGRAKQPFHALGIGPDLDALASDDPDARWILHIPANMAPVGTQDRSIPGRIQAGEVDSQQCCIQHPHEWYGLGAAGQNDVGTGCTFRPEPQILVVGLPESCPKVILATTAHKDRAAVSGAEGAEGSAFGTCVEPVAVDSRPARGCGVPGVLGALAPAGFLVVVGLQQDADAFLVGQEAKSLDPLVPAFGLLVSLARAKVPVR